MLAASYQPLPSHSQPDEHHPGAESFKPGAPVPVDTLAGRATLFKQLIKTKRYTLVLLALVLVALLIVATSSIEPIEDLVVPKGMHRQPSSPHAHVTTYIVTAATSSYFPTLHRFLCTFKRLRPSISHAHLTVVDLGLTEEEHGSLAGLASKGEIAFSTFEFARYPDHFRMTEGTKGEYAFRPSIVAELADQIVGASLQAREPVVLWWMDAGAEFTEDTLNQMREETLGTGCFAGKSGEDGPQSTGTVDYFRRTKGWALNDWKTLKTCNAASVSFKLPEAKALIDEWRKCAMEPACVAPEGSSRASHRQDQAALTILKREMGFGECDRVPLLTGQEFQLDSVKHGNELDVLCKL